VANVAGTSFTKPYPDRWFSRSCFNQTFAGLCFCELRLGECGRADTCLQSSRMELIVEHKRLRRPSISLTSPSPFLLANLHTTDNCQLPLWSTKPHHTSPIQRRTVIIANNNAHIRIVIPAAKALKACVPCFGAHAPNPASASVFAQTPIRRPSEKKSDEVRYEDARWHSRAVGLPFKTAKPEGKIATA
jgi:hypothetical protein